MRSLSNVVKRNSLKDHVQEYDFTDSFGSAVSEDGPQWPQDVDNEYLQTVDIFEDAIAQAEEIISQSREEAEKICTQAREEGHKEGYETGYEEGLRQAYDAHKAELDQQLEEFRSAVKFTIEEVTDKKNKIIETYIDDLKKITLSIAEKVIQTSLKSSGEIIKRMIVSASGKLKKTQWVKIYVSQNDAGMMIQGDVGLLNELSHLSSNIKIISMENTEDGTCIIELPEEIIDVSVNTQLENIKGILNNARL